MSEARYIKEAVIASLCQHPDAEKYRQRAFPGADAASAAEAMSQQLPLLKKADFLTPDDSGKFIIDSKNGWKNFAEIAKIAQDNGDKFGYEDFMKPLRTGQLKTFLVSAREHGGLANIFTCDIWQGRFEEMERLWHKVPVPDRKALFMNDGMIPLDLKRQIFSAENKVIPEDSLAKAGLKPSDIRQAFLKWGNLDEVNAKLEKAGDYLRKEYIMLTNGYGDTVFDSNQAAWNRYGDVVTIMKEHGEQFEIADYIRQVSDTKSILGRAAEHKALDKIFKAEHWADRLTDMLGLWSHVLDGQKMPPMTPHDFDRAYAEAENLTYSARFGSLSVTGKADLLKPLNEVSGDEKAVLPLGLKAVWDNFDEVQAVLKERGERLTISDLRTPTGQMGNSCLICAVKLDHFDKVISIARSGSETIAIDDFLSKDRHGNTLVSLLAEKKQLPLAFSAEIWMGRISEMKTLWSSLDTEQRKQVDFAQAESNVKQATLKQRKTPGKIKLKRPD